MSHYSKLSFKAAQVSRKGLQTRATSEDRPSPNKMLEEQEKKRSPTLSLEQYSTHSKDSRMQEHEQQRLKKAADFVKARERKSRQGGGWVNNKQQAHRQPESRKSSGCGVVSERDKRQWIEDTREDEFEGMVLSDSEYSNGMESSGMLVPEHPRYEVKLADLIKVGKPRKPKGIADFEVIPHVRSVIVLDDASPDRADLEVEEPWEHIYSTDNEDTPEFSYAQVAARSK